MEEMEEQRILTDAITAYNPRQIAILFSGNLQTLCRPCNSIKGAKIPDVRHDL